MTTFLEDIGSEDIGEDLGEAAWDGEDVGESEDFADSEDTRWDAARRARARRLALERRRAVARRQPPVQGRPATRTITPRQTVTAIRQLDLQTKVSNDSLRATLERANARARRANWVTVASLGIDQALDTFGEDLADHDFVRAGLRSLPLALLSPERKRHGVEGFILDPRVIGLAGVVGIVAAGKLSHRDSGVARVEVLDRSVSGTGRLQAVATDKQGRMLSEAVTFRSLDPSTLTVNPDGTFDAKGTGSVFVTATAGNYDYTFVVHVS
jgi:hypothetical protein